MKLKHLKGHTERLLEPLSQRLNKLGVAPNHVTFVGVLLSLAAALSYYKGRVQGGGLLLAISGICDLLDGNLARTQNKASTFGAFLDSTMDRYSDMFVIFGIMGLAFRSQNELLFWLSVFALVGSVMVSYTRARAESLIERCDVGLMERPERMLTIIIFSLLNRLDVGLFIVAVLGNLTAIYRIYYTYKRTKDADIS